MKNSEIYQKTGDLTFLKKIFWNLAFSSEEIQKKNLYPLVVHNNLKIQRTIYGAIICCVERSCGKKMEKPAGIFPWMNKPPRGGEGGDERTFLPPTLQIRFLCPRMFARLSIWSELQRLFRIPEQGSFATEIMSLPPFQTSDHGLINYMGTKAKCRCLKKLTCKGTVRQIFVSEFIDWRYSQTCWYFNPGLWTGVKVQDIITVFG